MDPTLVLLLPAQLWCVPQAGRGQPGIGGSRETVRPERALILGQQVSARCRRTLQR